MNQRRRSELLALRTTPEPATALDTPLSDFSYGVSHEAGPDTARTRRGWLVRRMLLGADLLALIFAFVSVELIFRGDSWLDDLGVGAETVVFLMLLPVWVVAAKLYGLYDRDEERATYSTADEVVSVFHLITVGVWLFYATSWIVGLSSPHQAKLATFWFLAFGALIVFRSVARAVARRNSAYVQNVLIVGAGDVGQLIARKLLQHPEYKINLVGFVDDEPKEQRLDLGGMPVLGAPKEIEAIVHEHDVDRVIVAFSRNRHEDVLELLRVLGKQDVHIDLVPRLFEALGTNASVHTIEGLPLLGLPAMRKARSSRFLKRCLDIAGAAVLLTIIAPVLLVIALLVRRDSHGPVFFRQTRLGKDLRPFTVLKFRTMREGTDATPHREYVGRIMTADALPTANNLYKLDRSDATTRVGRWLRKSSLDELPQLFNVLRGEMSLVGPRPLIPYEVELLASHHYERFLVPAGLTGLWQVEGRAHMTFREALDLDVVYARSWSLGLDLRLLLRTPLLMLREHETG